MVISEIKNNYTNYCCTVYISREKVVKIITYGASIIVINNDKSIIQIVLSHLKK